MAEKLVVHVLHVIATNLVTWLGGGILGVATVGLAASLRGFALSEIAEALAAVAGSLVAGFATAWLERRRERRASAIARRA